MPSPDCRIINAGVRPPVPPCCCLFPLFPMAPASRRRCLDATRLRRSASRRKRTAKQATAPMKPVTIRIDEIYVPQALRKPVDTAKVASLAESIADKGQETPILVRQDKARYVLVSGL